MVELTTKPAKAPNLIIFTTQSLPLDPIHARGHSEAQQGPQTVHFHRQNGAMGAISSPRGPEAHQSFQIVIFIAKTMPWEPFPARGRSEARQSSQTVHFHR